MCEHVWVMFLTTATATGKVALWKVKKFLNYRCKQEHIYQHLVDAGGHHTGQENVILHTMTLLSWEICVLILESVYKTQYVVIKLFMSSPRLCENTVTLFNRWFRA